MSPRFLSCAAAAVCIAGAGAAQAGDAIENDDCATCEVIAAVPFQSIFDNSVAAEGAPSGSCNAGAAKLMQNDVWFCYTPESDCLLTVSIDYSAVDGEGYDGLTAIYSGSCDGLTEIDCLDSGFGTSDSDTTVFEATGGTTYLFQVGDWGSAAEGGETIFDLDCQALGADGACCFSDGTCEVTDLLTCLKSEGVFAGPKTSCDPNPCDQPPIGACCVCGSDCQDVSEELCDKLGGVYQGDGSACETTSCPEPPTNDTCETAIDLGAAPVAAVGNNCCATDDDTEFCGTSTPNQGVWYSIVGDGEVLRASTCNPGSDFDTKLQVFAGACDGLECVGGNDDAAGSPPECSLNGLNRFSRVEWQSEEGVTYYILVGGFGSACGNFELTVEAPTGRCCYTCQEDTDGNGAVDVDDLVAVILSWEQKGEDLPADVNNDGVVDVDDLVAVILAWGACDPFECAVTSEAGCADLRGSWTEGLNCEDNPCFGACCFCEDETCDLLTEEDCAAAGGLYQGDGTLCDEVTCPTIPANDACADAIELDVPGSASGNNCCAADDETLECGTDGVNQGVWYTVTGTGNTLTATTCGTSDFDTKIQVFCNTCDELACIGGDDDDGDCKDDLLSTVEWCSEAGRTYYIHVGGAGDGDCGSFELLITEGEICVDPLSCTLPLGRCCITNVGGTICQDTTEPACLALGGDFVEGLSCVTDPCPLSYSVAACDSDFEDISQIGTEGPTGDDAGETVEIGFTFNFFGDDHTEIGISTNGYLTFGSDQTDFSNDAIPSTIDPNDLIAPFWDDYNQGDGGAIHYISLEDPVRFIVQWTGLAEFNTKGADTATFQAVLFEDGAIEMRYGPLVGVPSSAGDVTVGVENQDGTAGTGVDAATISEGDCLRFEPQ